jgi:hypothetical protein
MFTNDKIANKRMFSMFTVFSFEMLKFALETI